MTGEEALAALARLPLMTALDGIMDATSRIPHATALAMIAMAYARDGKPRPELSIEESAVLVAAEACARRAIAAAAAHRSGTTGAL